MHVSKFGVILAGLALGAAGCGTKVAGSAGANFLAAAVSQTSAQTARVAITTSTREQSMTTSFTAKGVFDFAHSRGMLSMSGLMKMTEIFLPPKIYIKSPSSGSTGLPKGKPWLAISDANSGVAGASSPFSMFGGTADPADLLASLTAISGGQKKVGTSTIRGVPVSEYQVNIDPAKAAARVPSGERAGFRQFAKTLGSGTIPVRVWVDGKNLVRRVQMTLKPSASALGLSPSSGPSAFPSGLPSDFPSGLKASDFPSGLPSGYPSDFPSGLAASAFPSGLPSGFSSASPAPSGFGTSSSASPPSGNFRVSVSTDYYDFGVPVHVSPPPAAQVASMSDLGVSLGMNSSPPKATGTLTPEQEAAAGQAATAFWTALGKNNLAAIERTVLPGQHSCVQSNYAGGPKITVNSFHIVSVEPAGTGKATVRYKVNAKMQGMPGLLPKDTVLWMSTTEHSGQWYVNLNAGTFFAGSCS